MGLLSVRTKTRVSFAVAGTACMEQHPTAWEEHSLASALSAVELPKSTGSYHRQQKVRYEEKYAHGQPLLEQIARDHLSLDQG